MYCLTISLEKRGDDQEAPHLFYIRDDLEAVNDCIQGIRYPRRLLKWAMVERWAMKNWCERRGIPLPEFWFPPGWNIGYVALYSENGENVPEIEPLDAMVGSPLEPPAQSVPAAATPPPPSDAHGPVTSPANEGEREGMRKLDENQRRRIACQEVGKHVWHKNPDWDVKQVANSPEVQEFAGGKVPAFEVLLRWLGEVDPRNPDKRRGPKRKK